MTFSPSTEGEVLAAESRLQAAGHPASLTPRTLDVLRLVADGVGTHRGLTVALGISSTNSVAQHLGKLVHRGLLTTTAGPGCPSRYTPTAAGWAAIGPCACIRRAVAFAAMLTTVGRYRVAGHPEPITCCPWCGRGTP